MEFRNFFGRSFLAVLAFILLAAMLSGCSKSLSTNTDSLYKPAAADVTSTATLADLEAGRTIFINNCGRCHNLYSPDSYAPSNWKTIIPAMAPRAGLSSTQASQVTKYVTRGK